MKKEEAVELAKKKANKSKEGAIAWQRNDEDMNSWRADRVPEDMEGFKANYILSLGRGMSFKRTK